MTMNFFRLKLLFMSIMVWQRNHHASAVNVTIYKCPPTASHAPTVIAIASPSPSEVSIEMPAPSNTAEPTAPVPHIPTEAPKESPAPSPSPSNTPTSWPASSSYPGVDLTASPNKSTRPRLEPTASPKTDPAVSIVPPSLSPTFVPIGSPSANDFPSTSPSRHPSSRPSGIPSSPSMSPPSDAPNSSTYPFSSSSKLPSSMPTFSFVPSMSQRPSLRPSFAPSLVPSETPYGGPSQYASSGPINSIYPSSESTSSPAPSLRPSTSLYPSGLPSSLPKASFVQAESLYQSGIPTVYPIESASPSQTPSSSSRPSAFPSSAGSVRTSNWSSESSIPSDAPSSYPSQSPSAGTKQHFANMTIIMNEMTGLMDDDAIAVFEEVGLQLLSTSLPKMGNMDIDFLFLQVEGQVFRYSGRRHLQGWQDPVGELTIYLRIAADIFPGNPEGMDFQWFMETFFELRAKEFAEKLEMLDDWFEPSSIQWTGGNPSTSDGDEEMADFFTTPLIIGMSISVGVLLIVGAVARSRPRRRRVEVPGGSPGRLGAMPSYDSEDYMFRAATSSVSKMGEDDPQSIFMSFSQASVAQSSTLFQNESRIEYGAREEGRIEMSVASLQNSSTSGSQLAGLDITLSENASSVDNKAHPSRTNHVRSLNGTGDNKCESNTLSLVEYEAIRTRSHNLMDDRDSNRKTRSTPEYKDVELQWQESSEHDRRDFTIKETPSQRGSRARRNKRLLEQKMQNSKHRIGTRVMQRLLEREQEENGSTAGVSIQDLILATSSLDEDCTQHYASTTLPMHSHSTGSDVSNSSRQGDRRQFCKLRIDGLDLDEYMALAEHIPVEETPQSKMKVYARVSDISGTVLRSIDEKQAGGHEDVDDPAESNAKNNPTLANAPNTKNARVGGGLSNWFRNRPTPEKALSQPSDGISKERAKKKLKATRRHRRRSLFGLGKRHVWDKEDEFSPLSPNKRYRRNNTGRLVPSRLAPSYEESEIEESDHDETTTPRAKENHIPLGIAPMKSHLRRPPMLNLDEVDSDDYDNVETPLAAFPIVGDMSNDTSSPAVHFPSMIYGHGMVHGQDPQGFSLSNHSTFPGIPTRGAGLSKCTTKATISDPPSMLEDQQDPPTASEYRRTLDQKRMTRGSSRSRSRRSRHPVRHPTTPKEMMMEMAVTNNFDAVILGSVNSESRNNMELEWGNVI